MSNPLFDEKRWHETGSASDVMSVAGAIKKTAFLMVLLLLSFAATWDSLARTFMIFGLSAMPTILVALIGALVAVLIAGFFPRTSPVTGSIYALLKGVVLGGISYQFNQRFHGLPLMAATLTIGTLIGMLLLYTSRTIRVTPMFTKVIIGATAGLALGVGLLMLLNVFSVGLGISSALYGNGWIGIGFSLVCVGLASFNLIIDFHVIEQGAANRAPKYMEWVGALGLVVTLAWLYLEILRLLAKLQSSRN
jgi:uncharacterized YccA/Bax inhibitor family protein